MRENYQVENLATALVRLNTYTLMTSVGWTAHDVSNPKVLPSLPKPAHLPTVIAPRPLV